MITTRTLTGPTGPGRFLRAQKPSLFFLFLLVLGTSKLSAQTTICQGGDVNLTIAPHRGQVQWQSSTNMATWTNVPFGTLDTMPVTPTSDTTWFRGAVLEGTCDTIFTDTSLVVWSTVAADAGPDRVVCSMAPAPVLGGMPSATGGQPPYTYQWTPSSNLNGATIPNPISNAPVPTEYVLTVTDAAGCMDMDTVAVDTGSGMIGDSAVFAFTGGVQFLLAPPCADSIEILAWGAQGENAVIGGSGGLGGYASGKISVLGVDTIWIYVGGQNAWNGGGLGGINGNTQFNMPPQGDSAGVGGGASDVRLGGQALTNRILVAGGGGGGGHNGVWPSCQTAGPGGSGGDGGGNVGGTGVGTPCNCQGTGGTGGQPGTTTAGGAAGAYTTNTTCLRSSWGPSTPGTLGQGGSGSFLYHNGTGGGGGGGGGYYGGGAGGNGSDTTPGGGGGGGSSYTGGVSNGMTTNGVRMGNGQIVIRW